MCSTKMPSTNALLAFLILQLANYATGKNCIRDMFANATYDPSQFHVSLHAHRSVQKGYRGDYDFIYVMRNADDTGEKSLIFKRGG